MRNSRLTRSSNQGNIKPITNNIRGTAASANLPKKERYPPLTQKSKEDDYISSLQKQVYYLELEMKLMKDRELDTKNKIGGYEVLFRDGVPLNENFLALKTKYKNERDTFEKIILDLNTTIDNTNKENENLHEQIEQTNKNYFDLLQKLAETETNLNNEIFDTKQKLYTTVNSLVHLNDDKDALGKNLYRFEQENIQYIDDWKKKMKMIEMEERNELLAKKQRDKNLAKYQKLQLEEKKRLAKEHFMQLTQDSYKTKLGLEMETDEFLQYAEFWIKEYKKQGKNINPLLLELKRYKSNTIL